MIVKRDPRPALYRMMKAASGALPPKGAGASAKPPVKRAFQRPGLAIAEAVAAIDRAVIAGLKGDLAGFAALGADGVKHLTGGAIARTALASVTAGFAALGLVGEASLSVKLLLTGGENEFLSALLAD